MQRPGSKVCQEAGELATAGLTERRSRLRIHWPKTEAIWLSASVAMVALAVGLRKQDAETPSKSDETLKSA